MRKDVKERMLQLKKNNIKPNYAKLGRQYNCDYRTIKKYYEADDTVKVAKKRVTLLDPFKQIVDAKLLDGCTFKSIYMYITKMGYLGKYTTLRNYCADKDTHSKKLATIRFETNPGKQAQVDWKESMTFITSNGELIKANIFIIILGYSRKKYIELTLEKTQDTVFRCLMNSFKYFGGLPDEILFDNMRTVVDHSKSDYKKVVINQRFNQFSKDMGFKVTTCRPYRPQTKGKVEAVAKLMDRLKVYNHEFDNIYELNEIIKEFNETINEEINSSTRESGNCRFDKEKEYLNKLPNHDFFDNYFNVPTTRKVTKESMISYNLSKYSVPVKFIGKSVDLEITGNVLYIYYNKSLIRKHQIENKIFNYDSSDYKEILKNDAFKNRTDEYIDEFIRDNLSIYDTI